MWYGLRMSSRVDADLFANVTELMQSLLRALILSVGGICLVWYIMATVTGWWEHSFMDVSFVSTAAVSTGALALYLLPRRPLASQAVWLLGLAGTIVLALIRFRQPEVVLVLSLLPLMATVTVGWPAGLLAEGLLVTLSWFLPGLLTLYYPPSYNLVIIAGGAIAGVLGWAVTRSLLTVVQWSLTSYEQARKRMAEAQEHRLELKQTRDDLVQANRELARLSDHLKTMYQIAEEARRAKEEFVANVSHELRTPLNMIIGFSEMIVQSPQIYGDDLSPALLSDIDAIYANSQHLSRLVDDVLDLSQVEADRMALSKEWTLLPEIIEAAVQAVHDLVDSKGLYLTVALEEDLPPVFCDSTRIRQVVLNLLSNASRFTERGGVRIRAALEEETVVVSVADTGPGIASQDQERLFEPFQQLDSSIRRRHGGSGLGLSISKRFVEMHGGKMWLESKVDVGTTFYFCLPIESPFPPSSLPADDARRWFSPYSEYEYKVRRSRSKAEAPVALPHFVVLERGETLQRLLARYLDGFEISAVHDTEQAIEALNRSPARALILNAPTSMGSLSPLDGLPYLPYGTPAIRCWVPGADEIAQHMGAVRYLVKPVAREALLAALEGLGQEIQSVLVVDDQPEVLQLFARMLSTAREGYLVLRADNGQRALSLLRERQPDVMLLDLVMPGMDGFQLLKEKEQDASIRDIPVVIVSSTDPEGEPVVSDLLTVTRAGGLSLRNLLACIRSVSEILSPSEQPGDRAPQERPVV